jgi:hypothetical protein
MSSFGPAGTGPDSPRASDHTDQRGARLAAGAALVLLAAVLAWWAAKEGAYFGAVLYPGIILLVASLLMLIVGAPSRPRLIRSPAIGIPLAALVGLGCLYALSATWSPSPDVAVADAQRILGYALACGLGVWLGTLLGSGLRVALIPVAFAAAVAGVVTIVALLTGDDPNAYLFTDGTLTFPLGYRNANAAFFLIALWPALGLAADDEFDWRLRGLAAGIATLCIALGILCQSRGSIAATPIALVVFLALSPHRARSLIWVVIALVPALAVVPAAADLYATGDDARVADAVDELRLAGRSLAGAGAAAILIGLFWARIEPRVTRAASRTRISWNLLVAIAGVGLAIAGSVAFVVRVGDPVEWVSDRFDELGAGNPSREGQATRFTFNAGSNRTDLWRVGLERGAEEPLLGDGGGGFQYSYIRERDVPNQYVRDAHSVALEVLSELGIPGLVLLLVALGGLITAALRSLRLGPAQRGLSAVALASAAYWLTHTSVDWFWAYPALTTPVLFLLGAACSPLARRSLIPVTRGARVALAAAGGVFALSVVPPFLAERYVDAAYGGWRADLGRAYRDLDRARALNPLTDAPLLAEGAIAREAGDRARAISAFTEAVEKRPEEYAGHYFLVLLYRGAQPDRAREELRKVRELDPLNPELDRLESSLAANPPSGP